MPDFNDPTPYPGVYRLKLPLAHSPLKYVNSYLLPSPDGHLLIDTGWNTEDTRLALDEQLTALGVRAGDIQRIVITHGHVDHYGLAAGLVRRSGARLGMHAVEAAMCALRYGRTLQLSLDTNRLLRTSGLAEHHVPAPEEMVARYGRLVDYMPPDLLFQDGDSLTHGRFRFQIHWTPGHSPGHICLYEPDHQLFFSGDHVLPGITAHIGLNPQSGPNPLGDYTASLNRLRHLPVSLMLPAHGPPIKGFASRLRQILAHHDRRNTEILDLLAAGRTAGLSAYDLVNRMTWRSAGRPVPWERLREFDQRLAVTEVMAHLEALAAQGRLAKTLRDGVHHYRLHTIRHHPSIEKYTFLPRKENRRLMNLGSYFIEKAVAKFPDTVSVISPEARLTNRQLHAQVCRLANALLGLGLHKGDRVAVLLTNSHQSVACFLGIACAGLALVPMNARNATQEHAFILRDSGARAVILGREFLESVRPAIAEAPEVVHMICVGGGAAGNVMDYDQLLAQAPTGPPHITVKAEDLGSIRYTAGTTGRPKGVAHTFGSNVIKVYNMLMDGFPIEPGDGIVLTAPVTHASGATITPHLVRGARVIILPKFEPEPLMRTVADERATTLYMVPTMLVMLLNHPRIDAYDLSSIKTIRYGASPIATDTLKRAIARFGHVFVQGYGLTEAGMPMTVLTKEDHVADGGERAQKLLKSIGREVTVASVRVVDGQDRELPPGEIGEIVVRSEQMMQGYWNNPAATAETLRDGWLHTRDLGYRDAEGYFYLVDRKNDMIVSGGFNVYPKEVEEVLYMHPAVLEAAVFGVPDALWGEAVKAVVSLKAGMRAGEEEIIAHCRTHLGGYKCPKSVGFMDELPKSAVGKILRRALKEPYWEEKGERKIN